MIASNQLKETNCLFTAYQNSIQFLFRLERKIMFNITQQTAKISNEKLYRAVWRWHFYAGLYVIPFMIILAVTGFLMMVFTTIIPEYGDKIPVIPQEKTQSIQQVIESARLSIGNNAKITDMRTAYDSSTPILVIVEDNKASHVVTVDPYTRKILRTTLEKNTWNAFFEKIHGSLFLGKIGDFLLEMAASLGIIMVVTGLYLWWPRNSHFFRFLIPNLRIKDRKFMKSLHETIGVWISVVIIFFMLTGLAWTNIWGGKLVQAWSTFPIEKWDNVPKSNKNQKSLNNASVNNDFTNRGSVKHETLNNGGTKQVPWVLEQTPLPQSSRTVATISADAPDQKFDFAYFVDLGHKLGFRNRFQVTKPKSETGVWTLSQDTMSHDGGYNGNDPALDRTVHIDQYSGKILADVGFSDYGLVAKSMAAGTALHEGQLGWVNFALNTIFCLGIVFLSVSGIIMWWKRRPEKALAAPEYAKNTRIPQNILIVGAVLAIAFPVGGLAIVGFAIFDYYLIKKLS
jgi:uncharacterized iron-regulated membrane protein